MNFDGYDEDKFVEHDLGCCLSVKRYDIDVLLIQPTKHLQHGANEDAYIWLDFKQARILADWIKENL